MPKSKSALLSRILNDDEPTPPRKNQMIRMDPALVEWVRNFAAARQVSMSDVIESSLLLLQEQVSGGRTKA